MELVAEGLSAAPSCLVQASAPANIRKTYSARSKQHLELLQSAEASVCSERLHARRVAVLGNSKAISPSSDVLSTLFAYLQDSPKLSGNSVKAKLYKFRCCDPQALLYGGAQLY